MTERNLGILGAKVSLRLARLPASEKVPMLQRRDTLGTTLLREASYESWFETG